MNIDFVQLMVKWVNESGLAGPFATIRIIFIMLDIILVIALFFTFIEALKFRQPWRLHPEKKKKKKFADSRQVMKQWQAILDKSKSNPPQSMVWSIIEADKLTDDVLKKMGLAGEHMADRLEKLNNWELRTLNRLWQAHRIRNELVHQPNADISEAEAKDVLEIYEKFLKEIEVI
jgi:hypothetical protein